MNKIDLTGVDPKEYSQKFFDHIYQNNGIYQLIGYAGTGKSTLVGKLIEKCELDGRQVVVTASTGVAAMNVGGVTLHRAFGLPIIPQTPNEYIFSGNEYLFRSKDLMLIIDEVSMVHAYAIDLVDVALKRIRKSNEPFGGATVLLVGDVLQLLAVHGGNEEVKERNKAWNIERYGLSKPMFFHSKALYEPEYSRHDNGEFVTDILGDKMPTGLADYTKPIVTTLELTHIWRQKDKKFKDILNNIRVGLFQIDDVMNLNNCFNRKNPKGTVTLCCRKIDASKINEKEMNAIQRKAITSNISGNSSDSHNNAVREMLLDNHYGNYKQEFKVGARVMFRVNHPKNDFVNGTMGTIRHIGVEEHEGVMSASSLSIEIDDGRTLDIKKHKFEETVYRASGNGKSEKTTVGECYAFPVSLAWAITGHKSQGLTFDNVNLILGKKPVFAHGLLYVMLSRVTRIEGLSIDRPINQYDVKASGSALKYIKSTSVLSSSSPSLSPSKPSFL